MTLRRAISVAGLDGAPTVLLSRLDDIRWLTGFTGGTATALFDRESRCGTLLVDGRYAGRARDEVAASGAPFEIREVRTASAADDAVLALSAGRGVGVDPSHVTAERMSALESRVQVVRERSGLDELRRVKDTDELDAIRDACRIADAALAAVVADGLAGRTERAVRNRLEWEMRERGADDVAFATIVATGPNGARPHHEPGDDVIGAGHAVVIDMVARVRGYRSDMTRTITVGTLGRDLAEMLETVREAQAGGLSSVRAGVEGRAVDAAARSVFAMAELEHEYLHGTGHGVGLAIHEFPILGPSCETRLLAGEVVTVEPGLYREGVGGVRIEDLVVVTGSDPVILTASAKDLSCPPSAPTI
ncbi:MAG: M24 family metallopeptidase [Actinomycetota bacterium]